MPKRVEFACGAAALPRTLTWRKSGWHVGKPHHVGGCRCSVTFCRPPIRGGFVPWREVLQSPRAPRRSELEGPRCRRTEVCRIILPRAHARCRLFPSHGSPRRALGCVGGHQEQDPHSGSPGTGGREQRRGARRMPWRVPRPGAPGSGPLTPTRHVCGLPRPWASCKTRARLQLCCWLGCSSCAAQQDPPRVLFVAHALARILMASARVP